MYLSMLAISRTTRRRVLSNDIVSVAQQFWAPQNAVLSKSLSYLKPSPTVCENDSAKSFTVSYLINSCGLSHKAAVAASKRVCFKSPDKPDAALKLLREYGFTDAHIPKLVNGWPNVLVASPEKTLLPKLEFFRSVGLTLPVLAHTLSILPSVLTRSLENSLIPCYNELKSLLGSDKGVLHVLSCDPRIFSQGWPKGINSNISMLRARGVPESSIVSLALNKPSFIGTDKEKFRRYVDRAVEMGFDVSKMGFVSAIRVFVSMSESTLERKMEVYARVGWSESDIAAAFLVYPLCMSISEKKIMAGMEFLVNKFGCKPGDVAKYPRLLSYNLEKRIKPRCLVGRILNQKGLLTSSLDSLVRMPEDMFLKRYIVKYEKDVPELLDIYRGKLSVPEMGW